MLLDDIDSYRKPEDINCDSNDYLTDDEQAIAEALAEHGDAFRAYYRIMHTSFNDVESLVMGFPDAYIGAYESFMDFAYEQINEELEERIPDEDQRDWVHKWFDKPSYARDLEESYFHEAVTTLDDKGQFLSYTVYVFLNI